MRKAAYLPCLGFRAHPFVPAQGLVCPREYVILQTQLCHLFPFGSLPRALLPGFSFHPCFENLVALLASSPYFELLSVLLLISVLNNDRVTYAWSVWLPFHRYLGTLGFLQILQLISLHSFPEFEIMASSISGCWFKHLHWPGKYSEAPSRTPPIPSVMIFRGPFGPFLIGSDTNNCLLGNMAYETTQLESTAPKPCTSEPAVPNSTYSCLHSQHQDWYRYELTAFF